MSLREVARLRATSWQSIFLNYGFASVGRCFAQTLRCGFATPRNDEVLGRFCVFRAISQNLAHKSP
ncbi:hypothetical protein ACWIUD_01545 [Helicobacter sp. 23-1044]